MKIILSILMAASCFGSGWFSKISWAASQRTGTGYLGEFIGNGAIAIVCTLAAIGFGIWLNLR